MARGARVIAVSVLLSVGACRPVQDPVDPEPEPQAVRDAAAGPTLEEIADAIDPGPRAALTVELPAWLLPVLELPPGGDASVLLAQAQRAWEHWVTPGEGSGEAATLQRIVWLVRALALAERAAGNVEDADPEVLLVLERAYAVLDAPTLANDRNLLSRLLQGFVGMLAQHGQMEGSATLEELGGLVLGALQKSGELHRRTVAALLRNAPEHPEIADVLGRLAPKIVEEDEALAVGVQQRALALRGEAAGAEHWLDLAAVCSRALEARCGREALGRAEALAAADDEALARRLVDVRGMVKRAHRAVELADAAGLDDGLERAAALHELQRYAEAKAVYEQLHRRHPDDARPVMGLARTVLAESLDFVAAFEIIERAQPREHLDREWYEMAIGVRATALVYHVLPQIADRKADEIFAVLRPWLLQLRQDIEALDALGADEGRVLRFGYDLGMEAWPASRAEDGTALRELARGLLPRAQALRAEVPGSVHAYTLWLAAAEFSDDRAAALGVLDVAPPPEHAQALVVRRAQAALDLVAAWDARDRVDSMLALVDAADGPERPAAVRRLVIDAHVVAHRLGRTEDLAALEQRYRALLEQGDGSDPVLLNNLAALVAEQGRAVQAQALWAEALAHADEEQVDVLRINAIAARSVAGTLEPDGQAELRELTGDGRASEVRLLAHAWLVVHARATGSRAQVKAAEKALREAAAKVAAENYRPRNLPGRGGVILRGSLQVGLGYSSVEGMQLQLDVSGVPWLMVPCPVAIPDPRARG